MRLKRLFGYVSNNLLDSSLLALIFVLPFFHKFSNLVLILIGVLSLIEIARRKKLPDMRMFWFLPALFVYYLVSELISGGTWSSIEKILLLLVVPLIFALNPGFHKGPLRKKIYLSFILGNFLAAVSCLMRALGKSLSLQDGLWVFNPKLIQDPGSDFFSSSVLGGNHFFGNELSWFLPTPTYFGIYIVLAQYFIFEILLTIRTAKYRWLCVGIYSFFLIMLFLLSSKAAIVSSLLLTFYIAYKLLTQSRVSAIIKFSAVSGILILSAVFFIFNPRLQLLRQTLASGRLLNKDARFGDDIRILTWDASIAVIKEHWPLGVGEGKKIPALTEMYKEKGYNFPAEQFFNSHNQFLDFLIGGGVIGIGLFVAGLAALYVRAFKERNIALLALLLIFTFNSLFENLLARHAGILLFAVFVSLLATRRHRHTEEQVSR